MDVMVIGSGGREHAVCKKLVESLSIQQVYCAPGNDGMKKDGIKLVSIAETNHQELIQFAKEHQIAWTFVGPEVPLLNGIVNDFQKEGLKIFGPTKEAALIEGSKAFAKELMNKYRIPTAEYHVFDSLETALAYTESQALPYVLKYDGLAAGKGVVIPDTKTEAQEYIKNVFKEKNSKLVIEEFLVGEEFSLLTFVQDGKIYPLEIAQDHKRAYDCDKGPNTGGMGAYSPVPQISKEIVAECLEKIVQPTVDGMRNEGREYVGILYTGLILTAKGPKVIEYNARLGDPETQVVLQRLTSDLGQAVTDLLNHEEPQLTWKETGYDVGVVVATKGYPGNYEKGETLPNFDNFHDVNVYCAGVKENGMGKLVSNGGRIYLVAASGKTMEEAQEKIYNQLEQHATEETFYRYDIGSKAIASIENTEGRI